MNIFGQQVSTPVVVGGVLALGVIGYKFYEDRTSSAAAGSTNSTSGTGEASPTTAIDYVPGPRGPAGPPGKGPVATKKPGPGLPNLAKYTLVTATQGRAFEKAGVPVLFLDDSGRLIPWDNLPARDHRLYVLTSQANQHGATADTSDATGTTDSTGDTQAAASARAAASPANKTSAAPVAGTTASRPTSQITAPTQRPVGQGTSLALPTTADDHPDTDQADPKKPQAVTSNKGSPRKPAPTLKGKAA